MRKYQCCFPFMVGFLGLFCHCVAAESNVTEESGDAPDATWKIRIEAGLEKRRSSLSEMFAGVAFAMEMDCFKMGRCMNFFMTVGVTSNQIGIAVQRDVGANMMFTNDLPIVTTNLSVNVPNEVLLDLKGGLCKYRYHRHAGNNAGWVRISAAEDGAEVVRWFDAPGWPHHKDQEVLRSLEFVRRTENEEVWRRFLGVYRAIIPTVNEFLKVLDQKPL